jgi:DNA-binding transcriptional regulator YhcF (GntR family)
MEKKIDPPYLRIVAEIRRRIADGDLTPGDRVPSTRQITREWGVALGTATKALTTLRHEGLVDARPRVGHVVAAPAGSETSAPRRPRPSPDQELSRERVVQAAIEIADHEGLDAVSMRGVAARLGVAAMSPYRHVAGKDDLILLMADAAYAEATYPDEPPEGWRARLELGARTLWALYRRHPWLAQISSLTRPLPLPSLLTHAEWALSALDGHGLSPKAMLDLHVLAYSHVQGMAVHLEREAQAKATTGQSEQEWMKINGPALAAIAASGRCPVFAATAGALDDGYDLDLDELFETGLSVLLDGMAPLLDGRSST